MFTCTFTPGAKELSKPENEYISSKAFNQRKTCIQIILLTVVGLILAFTSFAQSNLRFRQLNTHHGLASDQINGIVQDSLGFIWIQHFGGLSRYDGYSFKLYKYDPNDSLRSPGAGFIGKLITDASKNIWLFQSSWNSEDNQFSLIRYDHKHDAFISYRPPMDGNYINNVAFEKNSTCVWFAGRWGSGLTRYNYKTGEIKNYINKHPDSITQIKRNTLYDIIDKQTFLLLATRQGIWRFDKSTQVFSQPKVVGEHSPLFLESNFNYFVTNPSQNNHQWIVFPNYKVVKVDSAFSVLNYIDVTEIPAGTIREDLDGILWNGNQNGLYRYDPKTDAFEHFVNSKDDPFSISTNVVSDILIDRNRNLWVATADRGISIHKEQSLKFFNYKLSEFGGHGGSTIFQHQGKEYIVAPKIILPPNPGGTITNEILVSEVLTGKPGSMTFQSIPLQYPIQGYLYKFNTGKEHVWMATNMGVYGLPIDQITHKTVETVTLRQNDNQNSITSNNTCCVYEDPNRQLWIGVLAGGICKVNLNTQYGKAGSVTRFQHIEGDPNSLTNDWVFGFFPAGPQSYWTVTKSGTNLFRDNRFELVFKPKGLMHSVLSASDSTNYIGTSDGLFVSRKGLYPFQFEKDESFGNSEALGIYEDLWHRLWISDYEGIKVYDPKEKYVIEFNEDDGLDHTYEIINTTSTGFMITSDPQGVTAFDPSSLVINRNTVVPVITRLLINGKLPALRVQSAGEDEFVVPSDISLARTLTLDYKHNNFTLEFSAMEMTDPQKNVYLYQLQGYDREWIQTDWKNRTTTYTNLDAGDYIFRIKSSNHHGIFSDEATELAITILPPPWLTWWAYVGYSLTFLFLMWVARRSIVQRERLKTNLRLEHMALMKAQEIEQMKSNFFVNISHEFRTPLTLIKGPAQNLIEEFSKNPKVRDQLKLIDQHSDKLLLLINQLLDLAKLETGSLKVETSGHDLNPFLTNCCHSFVPLTLQKEINFHYKIPNMSYHAFFDKEKLYTIIQNLLSNAVKFTPKNGEVLFEATLSDTKHELGQLVIRVSDNGSGIPFLEQEKIFDRFYQLPNQDEHSQPGTGIGLSLVRELTRLMGGQVIVKSENGKGSEFELTLPLHNVKLLYEEENQIVDSIMEIRTEEQILEEDAKVSDRAIVMIVEDNADLRKFIVSLLNSDYNCLEALNGKEALDIAREEMPELILADVMMPLLDGLSMTEEIRKDPRTCHIPVILLTAKTTEHNKIEGLRTGANDYITKPFNREELIVKIKNITLSRQKLKERVRLELLKEAPKMEIMSADEKLLIKIKESIQELIKEPELSVDILAREVGLSRAQCYRKIAALTGLTVNGLIQSFRLQKAAQLLASKWGSVSQVAFEVGFSNPSYFSKCFKDQFGVLPSSYQPAYP